MNVSPLSKRIATAFILIPPVVIGVVLLPTIGLALLLGIMIILGAWEWAVLIGFPPYGYVALTGIALIVAWKLIQNSQTLLILLALAMLAWGFALFIVWRYPLLPNWWRLRFVQAGAGILILVPAWASLMALHNGRIPEVADGPRYTFFLFLLVWMADSAAFFSGKRWGKHQLAPRVSPTKTVEGLAGAFVITLLMATAGAWLLNLNTQRGLLFIGLCVLTLLSSVLGDLLESVVKRTQGAKDSGILLPGHGGVLDRIDSLTAACPVFVLGLMLLWRWTA